MIFPLIAVCLPCHEPLNFLKIYFNENKKWELCLMKNIQDAVDKKQ